MNPRHPRRASRRDFLFWSSVLAASAAVPGARARASSGARTLVLVELKGGNDGLNTLVPVRDPLYVRARPTLAIAARDALPFSPDVALHPALRPLLPVVERGELAAVLNVGYPHPNRSHFRSIEIWDQASAHDELKDDGWAARALAASGRAPDGIAGVLVRSDPGPLEGARLLGVDDPRALARLARAPSTTDADPSWSPAARHIVALRAEVAREAARLVEKVSAVAIPPLPSFARGGEPARRTVELAARLVAADLGVPVVKLTLPGFDTHKDQRGPHERLLATLAHGIHGLRQALVEVGAWERTLVVVTSEFGRRVAENRSRGTDHGAACPVLVIGAGVRGGVHGAPYRLDDLDDGDLRPTTLHRDVFASVAHALWGTKARDALAPSKTISLFG